MRGLRSFLLTFVLAMPSAALAANSSISLSAGVSAEPNIGKVIQSSPTGTGTFHVDAATGTVSVVGGSLARVGGSSVLVPTYNVICTNGSNNGHHCSKDFSTVQVTVHNPGTTPASSIDKFNLSVALGVGATSCTTPTPQNTTSVSFMCTLKDAQPADNGTEIVATVSIGMDITVPSVPTTGQQNPSYSVDTTP